MFTTNCGITTDPMRYFKRVNQMTGKQSAKTLVEYYAVGDSYTVKVRHFNQEGESSSYDLSTYPTKENIKVAGEEIDEQEFINAITKASDIIKARIY